MRITVTRFTRGTNQDRLSGLLGYVAIDLDGIIQLDGLALRMTETGALALSFPTRTSRRGTKHALLRPVNSAARTAIERTIFDALGINQSVPR